MSVSDCTSIVLAAGSVLRERPDQCLDEKANQGGARQRRILFRQMPAGGRRTDARGKVGGQRPAKSNPHRIEFRVDRLARHRKGQTTIPQRARRKGHDRG